MRERTNLTTLLGLIFLFIIIVVWWAEDRFGLETVKFSLISLTLVVTFAAGALLVVVVVKLAFDAAVGLLAGNAQVEKYRARGDAAERTAQAKLNVLEEKRIEELGKFRAKAVLDVERDRYLSEIKRLETEHQRLLEDKGKAPELWNEEDDEDDDDDFIQL